MLQWLAQQMETLLRDRLDRTPELREELSWFFQEPGQLQFFDALRVICESDGGFETVYDLGRRMAKMVVPEVHGLPGVTLEIGTKRLESLFNGFRAQVKSVGYGKAEIVTGFAPGSREGGWAFCRFVEGWLAGAVEQAAKKKVVSNKVSCVLNRGRFSFSDGELKVGPGREVVFYPKSSRTPKLVAKRSNSGRFKFRGTRFGEQCCSYRISWSPSSDELLTAIGFGPRGDRIRQGFSTALERIEEELDALRARLDEMGSFHQALLEFMRASGTIASTRELWESIARCVHRGIGLDRVAVFVIAPDGLQHVYYWDVDGRDLTTKASLNISPGSPEAKAVAEGRSVIAERLDHAAGVLPLFSQKWFSPGYVVAPIGEPPNYTHLLWADAYHKKRAPNAQEADEVNIVACAASLALSKFETIEKLEERVEERTRAQHELTLKLNRLYREVRDYEASKNRILSIVGHELKAPLNSILGLAQILLREMDGPLTLEQKQDIEAILKSANQLFELVGGILDLSRLESKRLKLQTRTVDLAGLIRTVVKVIASQAREKGLIFEVRLPKYLKAELDPNRIGQVVTNLCTNAIKHTDKGKIKLSLTEEDGYAIITVEDSGPGIPEPLREKIFEPFYQIDPERRGGLGLGLAISKRLVELHGGWIEVGDGEDGGARFRVKLPRWRDGSG